MKNIQLLNKIAKCGTDIFDKDVYAVAEGIENPDAIMVRSAVMHDMEFGDNLKAGLFAGSLLPFIMIFAVIILLGNIKKSKGKEETQ